MFDHFRFLLSLKRNTRTNEEIRPGDADIQLQHKRFHCRSHVTPNLLLLVLQLSLSSKKQPMCSRLASLHPPVFVLIVLCLQC
jgi:hypothetical protein